MPTTAVVNVNTVSGGDYTSLSAALSGEARNLTTADEILEIRVAGATADTTAVASTVWASFVCSATNKIRIVPASGQGATGIWDTSIYRLEVSNLSAFSLPTTASVMYNIELENFQIRCIASSGSTARRCINGPAGISVNSIFDMRRCVLRMSKTGGTATSHNIIQLSDTQWATEKLGNNLCIMEGTDVGTALDRASSNNLYAHNNTFIGPATGTNNFCANAGGATNTFQLKNNAIYGFSNFGSGNFDNSDYNSTDLSAATGGANDRVSQAFTFVDAGAADYRPASTDAALKGRGVSLSGDGNLPITTDLAGNAVNSPPEIGCLNYLVVSAAAAGKIRIIRAP